MKKKLLTILLSVFMMLGTITNVVYANAETKTIKDILPNDFPGSSSRSNGWINENNCRMYVNDNSLLLNNGKVLLSITTQLAKNDVSYSFVDDEKDRCYTFHIDSGKLEKINLSGDGFEQLEKGDYTVPIKFDYILSTVEDKDGFPETKNDYKTIPPEAWINSTNTNAKAYIFGDNIVFGDSNTYSVYSAINNTVDNDYSKAINAGPKLTFNMTQDKLVSITYEHSNEKYRSLCGTYVSPSNVAVIGNTGYKTLQEAINAATDGSEIKIISDISFDDRNQVNISDKNVILDLNGKTIRGSSTGTEFFYFVKIENSNVTIKDDSLDKNGKITLTSTNHDKGFGSEYCTVYVCGGKLTVNSGTIENLTNGGAAYAVTTSSNAWGSGKETEFNLVGGVLTCPNGDGTLRVYQNNSNVPSYNTVNITGGSIKEKGIFVDTNYYESVSNTNTIINISGGEVEGLIDLKLRHQYTKVNITGGKFSNCDFRVRKGSGPSYFGDLPSDTIVDISGGKFSFSNGKKFALNSDENGTDWGTYIPYKITNGIFNIADSGNISKFVPEGYEVVNNTDSNTKDAYPYMIGEKEIAKIGNITYPTLQSAVDASTGQTITLLKDIVLAERIMVDTDKTVILDLNGKTISTVSTFSNPNSGLLLVRNGGSLTINDTVGTGKITTEGTTVSAAIALTLKGDTDSSKPATLVVNGGTLEGNYYAIVGNGSRHNTKVTITGGTLEGKNGTGIYNPQDGTLTITGGTITGAETGVEVRSGTVDISGGILTSSATEFVAKKNDSGTTIEGAALAISQHNTDKPISVNITGGTFNGIKALYENDLQNETSDNITIVGITDGMFNGAIESENCKKFITGGYYKENNILDYIAPGYKCIDTSPSEKTTHNNLGYKIVKRTSDDTNKVVVTGNNDVPNYYEKPAELKDAVNNIIESNQEKEDNNKAVNITTITVDNSDGINAEIDDTIVIVAKKNNANTVTGVVGYNIEKEDNNTNNTTTYKAKALNVGEYVKDGTIKTNGSGTKASEKIDNKKTKIQGVSVTTQVLNSAGTVTDTTDNKYLQQIVADIVASNTEMAKLKLNQATAAKAINKADKDIKGNDVSKTVTTDGTGTDEVAAQSISIFVKTYYDTVITEDKTSEAKKSFTFDIKPMYQAFASTASDISQMNASGVITVAMGEAKELDNLRGKKITLTFTLPTGFINDVNQKVYVIHTLADGTKKTYDPRIVKNDNNFDISFDNADGFSVFEFTLDNPNPTVDPAPKPKSSYSVPKTGIN